MSTKQIDVSKWTRYYNDGKHPFWWGIIILIIIETTVVAAFISSFFYLWSSSLLENTNWFPANASQIPILYPTINTFLIFLCALSMYYGGIVMEKGKVWHFFWSIVFCCTVASIALYLRWLQFKILPLAWQESAYASFVWTMTGFHFVHLLSALLGTIVIGWFTAKGFYSRERRLGIQIDTLYWYFVFIAWLPMYFVLYWVPRI